METATLEMHQEVFMEQPIGSDDLPDKTSERALYIRRSIEDRRESQRLTTLIGEEYWDLD